MRRRQFLPMIACFAVGMFFLFCALEHDTHTTTSHVEFMAWLLFYSLGILLFPFPPLPPEPARPAPLTAADRQRILDLHIRAMQLAEKADAERRRGDYAVANLSLLNAYNAERSAALQCTFEPTRSILLLSAAELAVECKEAEAAIALFEAATTAEPVR